MSDENESHTISSATYERFGLCIEKLLQDRHQGRLTDIQEYAKQAGINAKQTQELTEVLAMTEILFDLERPRCTCHCDSATHRDEAASSEPPRQNGHSNNRNGASIKLKPSKGKPTGHNRLVE